MDTTQDDEAPVEAVAESEDTKKELAKIAFPMEESDVAPSALVPKACQSLQKTASKVEGVLAQFTAASQLSHLQQRILVTLNHVWAVWVHF